MTWAAVLVSATIALAAQTAPGGPSYADVVRLYRGGQFDAAIVALRGLSQKQVADGLDGVRRQFRSGADSRILEAAALLETEMFLRDRAEGGGSIRSSPVVDDLIGRLEDRDPRSPFVRRWRLLMTAFHQGRQNLRAALASIRDAADREAATSDPEFAHALAAIHEMAWNEKQERGRSAIDGDLTLAAAELRRSLALRRDVEAQVRLGRVLTLLGALDDAERALGTIETKEPGFLYLARLFEGDLAERRGDPERAARAYAAAIVAYPVGQSARVGLAHLRYAAGGRTEAAGAVQEAVRPRLDVRDSAEPWAWYSRGLAWHADGYLQDLRGMVFQPSK